MGVYANAAGPVGRGLDTSIGMVVGWGRLIVPVALVGLGIVLVRGTPDPDDAEADPASQSYLWVGGLIIAIGGCGLLHLVTAAPGSTRPPTSWSTPADCSVSPPPDRWPRGSRPGAPV